LNKKKVLQKMNSFSSKTIQRLKSIFIICSKVLLCFT